MHVPPLPKQFNLHPFLGTWIEWARIEKCFWPGAGRRAVNVDCDLAPIRHCGGIYVLAWNKRPLKAVSHLDRSVVYIGETSSFLGRMGGWGRSAGFWGGRQNGHSAAWRWSRGSKHLSVAFFKLDVPGGRRLAKHVRLYYEIVATEEHRVARGCLPEANEWEEIDAV